MYEEQGKKKNPNKKVTYLYVYVYGIKYKSFAFDVFLRQKLYTISSTPDVYASFLFFNPFLSLSFYLPFVFLVFGQSQQ